MHPNCALTTKRKTNSRRKQADNKSNQQNEFYLSIEPVWNVFLFLTDDDDDDVGGNSNVWLSALSMLLVIYILLGCALFLCTMYVIVLLPLLTFIIYYYFGLWTCTVASLPLSHCLNRQLNKREKEIKTTKKKCEYEKKCNNSNNNSSSSRKDNTLVHWNARVSCVVPNRYQFEKWVVSKINVCIHRNLAGTCATTVCISFSLSSSFLLRGNFSCVHVQTCNTHCDAQWNVNYFHENSK